MKTVNARNLIENLDLSEIPAEHQDYAQNFAIGLAETLINTSQDLIANKFDTIALQLPVSRSIFMANQLSLIVPFAFGGFWVSLFEWLKEVIGPLFDDEGVDLSVGTADTPPGTPTHGAIGLEFNFDFSDDTPGLPTPSNPPGFPVEFDGVPDKPDVSIKLQLIFDLDEVTPTLPPTGLSDFTFPSPGLEPGDFGLGFSIEFNF